MILFLIVGMVYSPESPVSNIPEAHATATVIRLSPTVMTTGTSWVVPSDWTDNNNTIEVIGGGGGGADNGDSGGGGGGGAYSKSVNVDLTPGDTITYQVGAGGSAGAGQNGGDGGDTFFCNSTSNCDTIGGSAVVVGAKGGKGGDSVTVEIGGLGGASASGVASGTGNAKYSGGNGGNGHGTGDSGGGGGGAAGPSGNGCNGGNGNTASTAGGGGGGGGANAGSCTDGVAGTSTVGGAGGTGTTGTAGGAGGNASNGSPGSNGSGGGGSDNSTIGGTGGHGIEWDGLLGSGGGGGGGSNSDYGGDGGLFGGGGGGGELQGGLGSRGIIVITYNGKSPTVSSWIVPSDWNDADNSIEVIGGGGAAFSANQNAGAAGGGGGAYSKSVNVDLTPDATVAFQVGRAGILNSVNGEDTYLCYSTSNCASINGFAVVAGAKGGTGATSVTANGVGGASASGVASGTGNIKTSGGNGGDGNNTGDCSGGGGGAGGPAGDGETGGACTSTSDYGGGGGGGAGGASSTVGTAGGANGGEGGAGPSGSGGGAGGVGSNGSNGTVDTGGGGGGGSDAFSGGTGATYNLWSGAGPGGGGGGAGDNTGADVVGGLGGEFGGGGGGGVFGGAGARGIIVVTYEPVASFSISGTADTALNGSTVKVAYNNSVQAQSTTINEGAWTISGATAPSATDIVTVWVDGVADSSESTAITEYSSGSISAMVLNVNRLFIGSNQNTSVSVTEADSYSCADDEDVMHSVVSGVLNTEGQSCVGAVNNSYTDDWLNVFSGNTLTVASASSESIVTEFLYFSGTLTATGTPSIYATDGFYNSGSGIFNAGSSTVELSSSSSINVNSAYGNETFYNLTLSDTGTKTSAAPFTVSNNLTISAGTLDDGGYQITGNGTGILSVASGATLKLGSGSTATTFPTSYTNGNISLNSASTVVYQAGVAQTISATPTYGNLTFTPLSGSPVYTLGSSATVAGNFLSNAGANFTNTGGVTVSGSGTYTVYDNDDIITGAITTNSGAILLNADRDANTSGYVNVSGAIASGGGAITIGGGSGTISAGSGYAVGNSGQATGVYVNGVTVAAGGGNVIVNGQGYDTTTSSNYGVRVTGASGAITTTGSGTIDINATAKGNTASASNWGLYVDTGGIISSVNGNLNATGTGGGASGSGNFNYGIYITGANSTIKTTGDGNLSVTGTGGGASGSGIRQYGVYCNAVASCIQKTTATGSLTVVGDGGDTTSGELNIGIFMASGGSITGSGGPMIINGSGGTGTLATNGYNAGINISTGIPGAAISNTGSGTITITAVGGGTGNSKQNWGLYIDTQSANITSVSGAITINATGGGGGTGTNNEGLRIAGGCTCGIRTTGGNIVINATRGGGDTNSNYGVYIASADGLKTTTAGDITVNTDTIYLEEANDINSAGSLTMATNTNSESIGVAGGTGTLGLPSTYLGYLTYVTSLTIGKSAQTGTTTLGAYASWTKPISFVTNASGAITVSGAQTNSSSFSFNGPTTLSANNISATALTIAGSTFNAGSSTITLSGTDTVFSNSGTFTAGTSTISITDSSASTKTFAGNGGTYATFSYAPGAGTGKLVLSGNNTFTSFSDTGTGAHTLEFTAGSTTTVTSFNIESATSSVITMQSSSGGTYWNLVDTAGTNQVRYVSITDSCASGGAVWDAFTYTADNTNGGHNCGWSFSASISIAGTSSGYADTTVVKLAINNTYNTSTTITTNAFTFSGIAGVVADDIITVWVDGVADSSESTAITKYASGNISAMVLNVNRLFIGSNQNTSVSVTEADSYSCADDEDVMHSVVSGVLNTEGQSCVGAVNNSYTDDWLNVFSGNTLTVASASSESIVTEFLYFSGTLTATGTPSIYATDGFYNSGSGIFNAGSSTVELSSSSSINVNSAYGNETFYNLTLSDTGTKTSAAPFTVSNNLTISAGTLDDGGYQITGNGTGILSVASGATLKLGVGGTATTFPTSFTNGNISLNSASTVVYQASVAQTVSGTPTYGNLTITPVSGTPTMTLGANTTVAGNLTLSTSSSTLQLSTLDLSVTGTTAILGTLNDNSATGTNLFTGAVTVNDGGTWTTSNDPAFEFRGGFTVNEDSTFTSGAGTYTFSTNAQTLGGTQLFTISNISNTITSGNGLTIEDGEITIGTLTQGTNAVLTFAGTVPTITTLTATASPNTVQYTGSTQTVKGTTYHHLIIGSAGTKTLGANTILNGNLTISAGTLELSTLGLSVTGTSSITGTFSDNSATGTNLFTGAVTINSGGVWTTTNNPDFEFRGGLTNNSSSGFTSGSGEYKFTTNAQTISGSQSFTIDVISNQITSGNGLTFSGSIPTVNTLGQDISSILTFTGTVPSITTLVATSTDNIVHYSSASSQTLIGGTTYENLTISDSGTRTLGGNVTINGDLTIGTTSVLDPTSSYNFTGSGTNVLTITGTARVQHSTFAGSYASFETITPGASSTVDYILNGTQTVDNTISYANLNISTGGTKTLGGATAVSVNVTIASGATLDSSTYLMTATGTNTLDVTGTLVVGGTNFTDSYTGFDTRNINAGSTVTYGASGAQTIDNTLNYVHLATSGSGVKTLGGNTSVSGNATIGANTTLDPTSSYDFSGSGTNILTNNGTIRVQHSTFALSYPSWETKTLTNGTVDYYLGGTQTVDSTLSYGSVTISTSGTKSLDGALSATSNLILAGGTFSSGNHYTINVGSIAMTGGTFTPGDATINLSSTGTVFNYSSGTYTRSGETINITDSSASSKTFAGGGQTFWNLNFAGTGTGEFVVSGSNTFNKLKITNPPHTVKFTAGTTQSVKFVELSGISGSLNTLNSTSNDSTWTISLTPQSYGYVYEQEFLSLRDSTASGNSYFVEIYAGSSTNTSNNSGWTFSIRSRGGGGGIESSATPDPDQGGGGQGGGGGVEGEGGGEGQGGGGQGGGGGLE